jgi:hypothetical protein
VTEANGWKSRWLIFKPQVNNFQTLELWRTSWRPHTMLAGTAASIILGYGSPKSGSSNKSFRNANHKEPSRLPTYSHSLLACFSMAIILQLLLHLHSCHNSKCGEQSDRFQMSENLLTSITGSDECRNYNNKVENWSLFRGLNFLSNDISVKASRRGRHLLAMMALKDSCIMAQRNMLAKEVGSIKVNKDIQIAQPSLFHLPWKCCRIEAIDVYFIFGQSWVVLELFTYCCDLLQIHLSQYFSKKVHHSRKCNLTATIHKLHNTTAGT